MEKANLNNLSREIIQLISNLTYEKKPYKKKEKKEFINYKTEILINLSSFLSTDYEQNITTIRNNEIKTNQCSKEKTIFLDSIKKIIIDHLNNIIESNPSNAQLKSDCIELIEAISIFLNPEKYNSNIEILQKQRNRVLTYKK